MRFYPCFLSSHISVSVSRCFCMPSLTDFDEETLSSSEASYSVPFHLKEKLESNGLSHRAESLVLRKEGIVDWTLTIFNFFSQIELTIFSQLVLKS